MRAVLMVVLGAAPAAGCGGHESKTRRVRPRTVPPSVPAVIGPGQLVPISAGRSLYLRCDGKGSPTVILEAGFVGSSVYWGGYTRATRPDHSHRAYDHAGLGNSLPVHDAADEIRDLHRRLQDASISPPYILVGHTYGGLLVRRFARADVTAGVVLVDSMGRNQDRRLLDIWRAQPKPV